MTIVKCDAIIKQLRGLLATQRLTSFCSDGSMSKVIEDCLYKSAQVGTRGLTILLMQGTKERRVNWRMPVDDARYIVSHI